MDALTHFVFAAINAPFAAHMMADFRKEKPKSYDEAQDHNSAVDLWNSTLPFRSNLQSSQKFFQKVMRDTRMVKLLEESKRVTQRLFESKDDTRKEFFDRKQQMETWEYAARQAADMIDLLKPMKMRRVPQDATVN
jgi:hypothetical protein